MQFIAFENYQQYAHKLSCNACAWHELVDPTFSGQSTNLLEESPNGAQRIVVVTTMWTAGVGGGDGGGGVSCVRAGGREGGVKVCCVGMGGVCGRYGRSILGLRFIPGVVDCRFCLA